MDEDAAKWRSMLMAEHPAHELLRWLREDFLDEVLNQMNTADVRRRIGLYGGDRIPENERNLTDARNRVSLIAEYEMARVSTRILESRGIEDIFFSYVVANRFPDLELRNDNGNRGIRIEVKCLESIAEEKSANFDTIKKDIDPRTDFVVIFLWEWKHDGSIIGPSGNSNSDWDRAPEFLRVFCFHAASLAHMRDWYWLNSPPTNLGDGLQGFDLRYGVNCNDGNYNQEEGNYGKLMRMWADDFPPAPDRAIFLRETPRDYLYFRRIVIEEGFFQVCRALLSEVIPNNFTQNPIIADNLPIGMKVGPFCFVLRSLCPTNIQKNILRDGEIDRIFVFSDKYSWAELIIDGNKLIKTSEGKKPKHIKTRIRGLIVNHQGLT